MKIYPPAIEAYHAAGKAHWQISYISVRVRGIDTPSNFTWFHFCTDEDDRSATVKNQVDDADLGDAGETSTRLFLGGGHIVAMGDLTRSEKEIVRSHTLALSGASDVILDMVHGYNCRGAHFEWHIGELDQDTGDLIADPVCEFVGMINTIDLSDGALAIDNSDPADTVISVAVDSLGAALTARNYDMRSKSSSENRGGDKFFQYADSAHHWRVRWGKEKRSEHDRRGGNGSRDRDPRVVGRPDHT